MPRSIAGEIPREKHHYFYAAYLLCMTGLAGMTITGDAFNIFVFMEISSLASYVIIAGGSEAVITPMALAGFASMRALSTRNDEPERASRPWDRDRDGFVIGEGAGITVLEDLYGSEEYKAHLATVFTERAYAAACANARP